MTVLVCIKCKTHKQGCTFISDDGMKPVACIDTTTMQVIACEWMEVPTETEKTQNREIIIA